MIGTTFKEIFNKEEKSTNLVAGIELIQSEIEFLLKIEKHSLFFGNDIGIDFNRFLYLRNRTATYNLIKTNIENLILKYNRVYLNKVIMIFNEETSTAEIELLLSTDTSGSEVFSVTMEIRE